MTERMIDDIILLKKLAYWGGTPMNLTMIQISVYLINPPKPLYFQGKSAF